MCIIKQFLSIKNFIFCLAGILYFSSCAFGLDETSAKAQALAHYTMGLSHDWNGLPDQALAEYEKASQLDPNNYVVHLKLGVAYARAEKIEN